MKNEKHNRSEKSSRGVRDLGWGRSSKVREGGKEFGARIFL